MATAGDQKSRLGETCKQLAHQVEKGRKVTFWPPDGDDPIVGYVAGWDGEESLAHNWFVLEPTASGFVQHMVPQAGTRMRLHMEVTFEQETHHAEMDKIVSHFRRFIRTEILNRGSDSGPNQRRTGTRR